MVTAWIIKQKFLDKQKKREDAIRAKAEAEIAELRAAIRAAVEAEIRAETQAEDNRRVQEWDRRRMRAILLNQPFHEPPPDLTKP